MQETPTSEPLDTHVGPFYTKACFTPEKLRETTSHTIEAIEWLRRKGFVFGAVAGIGHSGSLLVGAVALMTDLNPIIVRKEHDDPGHSGLPMTGEVGVDYVLVDDFMSSGKSLNRVRDVISSSLDTAINLHKMRCGTPILPPPPAELKAMVCYGAYSGVLRPFTRGYEDCFEATPPILSLGAFDGEEVWEKTYQTYLFKKKAAEQAWDKYKNPDEYKNPKDFDKTLIEQIQAAKSESITFWLTPPSLADASARPNLETSKPPFQPYQNQIPG